MKKLTLTKLRLPSMGALLLGILSAHVAQGQSYTTIFQTQSPIDWWRFEETTASPAVNTVSNYGSVGAAGTGYVVDGAVTGVPGIVGNAVLLVNTGDTVGNCNTRVDIPNNIGLNPVPPFSIEFWVKPTSVSSDSTGVCILSSMSPFPGDVSRSGYLFYANTPAFTFRIGGENSYTATAASSVAPVAGTWTHIVGEFDGTKATIYINGVLSGSGNANISAPFHPNRWAATRLGGTSLLGGEYVDGNGGGAYYDGNRGFDGAVDEFAVYNYLLSSNTVSAHYAAATTNNAGYDAQILAASPVGYWNLDEPTYTAASPSYTLAADSGSVGDNGTNTLGTVADQPGVPGLSSVDKSVVYNGAAGSLVLDTGVTPPDVAGGTLTLAAWIKPTSFGYLGNIIAQGYDEKTFAETFLREGDAFDWESYSDNNSGGDANSSVVPDVAYYQIGSYDGGGYYVTADFPAPIGDLGHWVFLVGTYDGENWNLYRNGALVAQFGAAFSGGGSGPAEVGLPWTVGARSNPNEYMGLFFAGAISEPAILTTALSAATISNLYNAVQLPPVITSAPVAPSPAYLGSSATFSIWADGPGTLAYQWYSNNVAIPGQTGTNFSLTGLIPSDSATYSVVVTNTYGAITSTVPLSVTNELPPLTIAPAAEKRWLGSPLSFAPANLPAIQLSFQWQFNGTLIPGATNTSYTNTTTTGDVGSYTLVISNSLATATSSVATLTALAIPTNTQYPAAVLGDNPIAYFRLDEPSGTVAYDYAGGNNGNYYGGITLGVPGYSLVDTDTAVFFPGAANDYVGDIGPTSIDFAGGAAEFSIEAWANGGASQIGDAAIIAKGQGNNGGTANEQFAIAAVGGFYQFFVRDPRNGQHLVTTSFAPDGTWHHFVGVYDSAGGTMTFYIDGAAAGSAPTSSTGVISSTAGVSIGAEKSGVLPPYDWSYTGSIDEVAIYNYALSGDQVANHFAKRYGSQTPPFITAQPMPVTNYVGFPASVTVSAAGTVPLTYQWNKVGSGAISGATDATFTIPGLALTDAGTYTVGITNTINGSVVTGILSAPVVITVLPAPTAPVPISGLVMHLTFDNTLADATGRGNNGTNEASGGAPLITNNYVAGQLGEAFQFTTTAYTTNPANGGTTNANYASLGFRPDLQFGSGSFTVSMWVNLGLYQGYDIPFLTDVPGSTFGSPGYVFAPNFGLTATGATSGANGGVAFSVFDQADAGVGAYGQPGTVNDGGWHSLVYVMDRLNGASVYLDGYQGIFTNEEGTTIVGTADIDSTNIATIGQDPTGLYEGGVAFSSPTTVSISIDDLCVWKRALTQLEARSIYVAGTNNVSVAGVPLSFTLQKLSGSKFSLNWNEGSLQSATNLLGPWTTISTTPPYTNAPAGASTFFRVKF